MGVKRRTAILVLLIMGLIATPGAAPAPGLGAVAKDSCPPCCPQPVDSPCQTGAGPCVSLTAVPCCDGAPAAPASRAKRSADSPNVPLAVVAVRSISTIPRHAGAAQRDVDLSLLTSPLRLSVVLLI